MRLNTPFLPPLYVRTTQGDAGGGGTGSAPPGSALLSAPVLDVLGYLGWRGLRLGLLPRGRTVRRQMYIATARAKESPLTSSSSTHVQITPTELLGARPPHAVAFDTLLPLAMDKEADAKFRLGNEEEDGEEEEEQRRRQRVEEGLRWLSDRMHVEPRRLLVVTGEGVVAAAGRGAGCFTCCVEGDKGQGGTARADYWIGSWEELKDVVEDLNGVSLRPWPPR